MKGRIRATDIALTIISFLFLIGTKTIFGSCGPKEDGSFMTCHWAGQALFGIACVMAVLAILHLVICSEGVRMGLDLAFCALAALVFWLPGKLIPLCMMPSMHCRMTMKPGSMVFAALLIIAAAADMIFGREQR